MTSQSISPVKKVIQPLIWILGVVLVGGAGLGAAQVWQSRQQQSDIDLSSLTVPVTSKDLTVRIAASGTVVPIETVNLSPKTSGRVQAIYVKQGDTVAAGQVIARMEQDDVQAALAQANAVIAQSQARLAELKAGARPEEVAQAQAMVNRAKAAIAQAEAMVAQAKSNITEAQSRLDLTLQRVERNRMLVAEGAVSRDVWDEVQSTANNATAAVRSAEANYRNAQANLEVTKAGLQDAQQQLKLSLAGTRPEQIAQAEAQLRESRGRLQAIQVQAQDTLIRTPFAGVITQRYADPGDFVTPTTSASSTASATSTSVVALASGLEVLARVPEVDIGRIRLGQSVEIIADAYPEKTFQGQVRLVAPEAVVEQNVTSFQVRIDLTSGNNQLKSGMNVNLEFLGNVLPNALVIPTVAVVTQQGQAGVLVPDAKKQPSFKPVTIGSSVGNQTQIISGLEPNEKVFVELPKGKKLSEILKTKDLEK